MKNSYIQHYKRLGGLGPNIGGPDWEEKKQKASKINEFIT